MNFDTIRELLTAELPKISDLENAKSWLESHRETLRETSASNQKTAVDIMATDEARKASRAKVAEANDEIEMIGITLLSVEQKIGNVRRELANIARAEGRKPVVANSKEVAAMMADEWDALAERMNELANLFEDADAQIAAHNSAHNDNLPNMMRVIKRPKNVKTVSGLTYSPRHFKDVRGNIPLFDAEQDVRDAHHPDRARIGTAYKGPFAQ